MIAAEVPFPDGVACLLEREQEQQLLLQAPTSTATVTRTIDAQSTADGRIYLKREEECLAGCAGAPMMVINGHYHERLTVEKVDELLDGLE